MVPFIIKNEDTKQFVKQTMHIEPIFPIPVGFVQIDEAVNKKILELIKIKKWNIIKNTAGNSISSDKIILDNDELSDIKKVLTDSVNEFFKEFFDPNEDIKLYITTSWLNLTKNGESHHPHTHPNSIVSAILYIDTCEEDTISFVNERNDIFGNLRFDKTDKTNWLTPGCNIMAMVNRLVMFPSTLPHLVNTRPNKCTGTRISLSFNTWIRGKIGGEGTPDQLHL